MLGPTIQWPFFGSQTILNGLRLAGHTINRKRVQRLMQLMGLQAGTAHEQAAPEHPIYPYPTS
ncbi:MAG: hypothetical protein AMXMBFR34_51600 [Myxococcaceae bacterium]